MGGSCEHEALCTCPNATKIIDHVKMKIECCIQKYMSLEEIVNYLQENYKITHNLTEPILELLQRDSPDFFKNYHLRCKLARQTEMFDDLLAKQVTLMIEHGYLDICDASRTPAVMNFLVQHPEGARLMEKLANTSANKTKATDSSLALGTNSPRVTQLQILNDQQNQFPHWSTSNNLSYNNPEAPIYAQAATGQRCSSSDLAYIGAQTVAQASTMLQDPSTPEVVGVNGHYSPSFQDMERELELLFMQHEEQQLNGRHQPQLQLHQNFSGEAQETLQCGSSNWLQHGGGSHGLQHGGGSSELQYGARNGPQYRGASNRLQHGGSNELHYGARNGPQHGGASNRLQLGGSNKLQYGARNRPQYGGGSSGLQHRGGSSRLQHGGGSNGLQNGESIEQQLCHDFDIPINVNVHKACITSVDQQQTRGVIRHHPESEASNSPDSDDGISKGKGNSSSELET